MPIKCIAIISQSYMSGIAFVKTLHRAEHIREIRYQSGYIALSDGSIYQIITREGQAQAYEFTNYLIDPFYKSLEEEVRERIR